MFIPQGAGCTLMHVGLPIDILKHYRPRSMSGSLTWYAARIFAHPAVTGKYIFLRASLLSVYTSKESTVRNSSEMTRPLQRNAEARAMDEVFRRPLGPGNLKTIKF